MAVYDKIGINYNKTRKADLKIFSKIYQLLEQPENKKIIDVGAGTGNYSQLLAEKRNSIVALEPSYEMIKQNMETENIQWIKGFAEDIDLENDTCDGAICILSIHHFSDLEKSFNEIRRILKSDGRLLIYTYMPQEQNFFWLQDYFPKLFEVDKGKFPNTDKLGEILNRCGFEISAFEKYELHYDLKDNFLAASWRKPENYLKEEIRKGISTFSLLTEEEIETGVNLLKSDLDSGLWNEKYGGIKNQEYFDAGYRFVKATKKF